MAGTVTLDDVTTPWGRRTDQLGGSAVYFALAAARLAPVILTGVVGRDGEARARLALTSPRIRLDGLAVVADPTFRWRALHDFHLWETADEASIPGAYAGWRPRLPPAAAMAPVLFAGSMHPALQAEVMRQSSARLVGIDTMRVFIDTHRGEVRDAVRCADILFVDRAELELLSGMPRDAWISAARSLCGDGRVRAVVVKAGPDGAACVTATEVHRRPAVPVGTVVDPTGAGDALAGGFLGLCARDGRADDPPWDAALDEGLECAAAAIREFGIAGLRQA